MADTKPKPFVFVLMPFDASFNDVYQLGIKPAGESAGAYCERIDEQIFAESILARVYNQIAKADLIVADMTGRNPNVFYEVGYAHALGKTVILLTKNADDIPFDLKHYPHIVYQASIAGLKDQLHKRIVHHLANPTEKEQIELLLPRFAISGTIIEGGVHIQADVTEVGDDYSMGVGVNNPYETVIDWSGISIGLILPKELRPSSPHSAVQMEDKRYLYDVGSIDKVLPGAWETQQVYLAVKAVASVAGQIEAELRIFTANKPVSIPFYLSFI